MAATSLELAVSGKISCLLRVKIGKSGNCMKAARLRPEIAKSETPKNELFLLSQSFAAAELFWSFPR
jgi:hypothetical protein